MSHKIELEVISEEGVGMEVTLRFDKENVAL